MASAAVHSKAVVLLLFIHWLLLLLLFMGYYVRSFLCYAILSVFSCFAIIPLGKRELFALLSLSSECHVAVIILCLFLTVLWISL